MGAVLGTLGSVELSGHDRHHRKSITHMQVILLEDVKAHGHKGDVVEVSEGYARNFLFPAHLAIEASKQSLGALKEKEEQGKRQAKKSEHEDRKLAAAMDGCEVVVHAKSEGGKLFAAVGPKQVREQLKEMGFKVNEEQIEMTPMKTIGSETAIVNFESGYEATITVVVEA